MPHACGALVFPELYEWWNFKKICGFQETGKIEMA